MDEFLAVELLFRTKSNKEVLYLILMYPINLRLILVSGKTKEFVFSPVDSAGDIAIHVYDNWPEADWATECVSRAEILRLIYQGRFLHSSVTLGALGLPLGRTTVMHLVPREHLPEPNSHDLFYRSPVVLTIPFPINGKKVKAVPAVVVQRPAAYCNSFLREGDALTRAAVGVSETADSVAGTDSNVFSVEARIPCRPEQNLSRF
ncbi:hypothetical protein HW555_002147 [Spodoptera exigua]|uniref:UBL3-like ubiquitin domain-containing protein n=1 Tax=Spodoptera exigua TaxID=7107 RepID=A0A835GQA5_SPOEX|nr:hypothetical protein HW555_002147 [Spodoptera exigua]